MVKETLQKFERPNSEKKEDIRRKLDKKMRQRKIKSTIVMIV